MSSYWSNRLTTQEAFQRSSSCRFKGRGPLPSNPNELTHNQLRTLGLTNSYIKSGTPPAPPAPPGLPAPLQQQQQHTPEQPHYQSPESYSQAYTPPTPPSPPLPPSNSYTTPCTGPGLVPNLVTPAAAQVLGSTSTLQSW